MYTSNHVGKNKMNLLQNPKAQIIMHMWTPENVIHLRSRLVWSVKVYRPSLQMFGHMHEVLNIEYLRN